MTEPELNRNAAPGNHPPCAGSERQRAKTCRYYGITRHTYYKWLRRYEEFGIEGLRDRCTRMHVSPNATTA